MEARRDMMVKVPVREQEPQVRAANFEGCAWVIIK